MAPVSLGGSIVWIEVTRSGPDEWEYRLCWKVGLDRSGTDGDVGIAWKGIDGS